MDPTFRIFIYAYFKGCIYSTSTRTALHVSFKKFFSRYFKCWGASAWFTALTFILTLDCQNPTIRGAHSAEFPIWLPDINSYQFIRVEFFGRSVVKRFSLCCRTVVCLSCLSVTLVYCGQTPLSGLDGSRCQLVWRTGGRLRPRPHYVRWGPSSTTQKGHIRPQFLAHVYCGEMAGWINLIKMSLCTEVGLSHAGHIVRWGPSCSIPKVAEPLPTFRPVPIVAKRSPILAAPGNL